jgi:hypothetical protein
VLAFIAIVIGGLAGSSALTLRQPDFTPVSLPTTITLIGWAAALVVLLVLVWLRAPRLLALAAVAELFLAAHVLPFNDLSSPEVYYNRRFTTDQLLAYREEAQRPTFGRLLSISELLFDPGDRFALEARFHEAGMSEQAIDTAFTAVKMQETQSANLPVLYGLPSVDGFDGGLLPTAYYTAFTSLLLPPDELRTIDGRLREILSRLEECRGACIPDQRWLNLMGVQYLITDKIYDEWHDDIAYDTTFERVIAPDAPLDFEVVPPFRATALNLLVNCPVANCANVTIIVTDLRHEDLSLSVRYAVHPDRALRRHAGGHAHRRFPAATARALAAHPLQRHRALREFRRVSPRLRDLSSAFCAGQRHRR